MRFVYLYAFYIMENPFEVAPAHNSQKRPLQSVKDNELSKPSKGPWKPYYNLAVDAYKKGDYTNAILYCSKSKEKFGGDNWDVLRMRVACWSKLERFEEIVKDTEGMIALKPEHAKAYLQQCTALLSLGRVRKALKVCQNGLKKCNKEDASLYLSLQKMMQRCHRLPSGPVDISPTLAPRSSFIKAHSIMPKSANNFLKLPYELIFQILDIAIDGDHLTRYRLSFVSRGFRDFVANDSQLWRQLTIIRKRLTPKQFQILVAKSNKSLSHLVLAFWSKINAVALRALPLNNCYNLTVLSLYGCSDLDFSVVVEVMQNMFRQRMVDRKLPMCLQHLDLSFTKLTDKHLNHLLAYTPQLKLLSLSGCFQLSKNMFQNIVAPVALETVNLAYCDFIRNITLNDLQQLCGSTVKSLDLRSSESACILAFNMWLKRPNVLDSIYLGKGSEHHKLQQDGMIGPYQPLDDSAQLLLATGINSPECRHLSLSKMCLRDPKLWMYIGACKFSRLATLNLPCNADIIDANLHGVALSFGENLTTFNVEQCIQLTSAPIVTVFENAPNLQIVNLSMTQVSTNAVLALSKLKHLRSVNLSLCAKVTGQAVIKLLKENEWLLKQLRVLCLDHCPNISNDHAQIVKEMFKPHPRCQLNLSI